MIGYASMPFICFVFYCIVEGVHTVLMGPFLWRSLKIELLCAAMAVIPLIAASALLAYFVGQGLDVTTTVHYGRFGNAWVGIIGAATCVSTFVYYLFHQQDMNHGIDWTFAGIAPLATIILHEFVL